MPLVSESGWETRASRTVSFNSPSSFVSSAPAKPPPPPPPSPFLTQSAVAVATAAAAAAVEQVATAPKAEEAVAVAAAAAATTGRAAAVARPPRRSIDIRLIGAARLAAVVALVAEAERRARGGIRSVATGAAIAPPRRRRARRGFDSSQAHHETDAAQTKPGEDGNPSEESRVVQLDLGRALAVLVELSICIERNVRHLKPIGRVGAGRWAIGS